MNLIYKTVQIEFVGDKKELLSYIANKIKAAIDTKLEDFTDYGEFGNRFATIENHEILFKNDIVVCVTARIDECNEIKYSEKLKMNLPNIYKAVSIDNICIQLDGEEVDLLIDGESIKSIISELENILC